MATTNPHQNCKRQTAFAWAKFYERVRGTHVIEYRYITRLNDMTRQTEEVIPTHIKNELLEMAKELKKTWECPICIDTILPDNLEITNCGHSFCKTCLEDYKARARAQGAGNGCCPTCRRKFAFTG